MSLQTGVWYRLMLPAGLVSALIWSTPATAQIGGSGTIQGVGSDPSAAVIPNATVTATNAATGVQTSRQTTSAGYYSLSLLPAGVYSVTVTAHGFRQLVQQSVVVDALSVVGVLRGFVS